MSKPNIKGWKLTDPDLPEEFALIKSVFLPKLGSDRDKSETLHDYLTRKKIKCWCKTCRYTQAKTKARL